MAKPHDRHRLMFVILSEYLSCFLGAGSGIGFAFCLFAATLGYVLPQIYHCTARSLSNLLPVHRSTLILVDYNTDAVDNLKKEIDGNNVSGQAFVAPRTSVTVSSLLGSRNNSPQ